MRPAFCPIDTVAIRNLLTLDASYANKQAQLRKEKQKVVCERRERIASAREQAGLPKTMVDDFDPSRWSLPCDALGACPEIQRHVRGWLGRRKAAKRRHAFTLQRAKTESWSKVLHLDKKVKIAKGYQFAGSIRTDGVSVRLLFDKAQTAASGTSHSKKRKRATDQPKEVKTNSEGLPRPGLYTIDQVKHLSRIREAQIIGADPGKRELLVCADIDDVPDAPTFKHQKVNHVRYTSAQRRKETLLQSHTKLERSEVPEALASAQKEMANHCSRSSHLEALVAYFTLRREMLTDALSHFGDLVYRKRAWSRFIRTQKSLTNFVRRIRGMSRENAPMVLAYGAWASVAGRPGAPCNKGCPPCPGIGLRKKLSHHFIVVHTPEHYTSKTCSACGALCGPCEEVDAERRMKRLASATTDAEKKKAAHFSVRGLRRCHNAECAIFHNRDYNAAVNIGHRCKSLLLTGQDHLPSYATEDDEELSRLAAEVEDRF